MQSTPDYIIEIDKSSFASQSSSESIEMMKEDFLFQKIDIASPGIKLPGAFTSTRYKDKN